MMMQRMDLALDALRLCRARLPDLVRVYSPGSPEALALAEAQAALERADAAVFARDLLPSPSGGKGRGWG